MSEAQLFGVKTAAKMLNMSEYMVRHWTRKGELQHERVDGGTAIVYRMSELERFRAMISGLTSQEVGELLGVSDGAVRQYVVRGEISARKALGELRFDLAEVQKFASERGIQLREPEARKAS